jgi:serine/threonine-protein kinase
VYEGVQARLGRRVAIKLTRESLWSPSDAARHLAEEARATSAVSHPNVVQILDVVTDVAGPPFLVMELLAGRSLAAEIAGRGAIAPARVRALALQALSALETVHEAALVHRDITPGNLFLVPLAGRVELLKLVDFGVAEPSGSDPRLVGTPRYMAPEQLFGGPADPRSDLYSLAVVMVHALCGRLPTSGPPYEAAALRLRVGRSLDLRLARTLERALTDAPEERFPTARAMAQSIGAP